MYLKKFIYWINIRKRESDMMVVTQVLDLSRHSSVSKSPKGFLRHRDNVLNQSVCPHEVESYLH